MPLETQHGVRSLRGYSVELCTRVAAAIQKQLGITRLALDWTPLDAVNRLLRYPCSYMVYSDAFDGLPQPVRDAVYARMLGVLSGREARAARVQLTAADARAILEILRETKPDFPGR